MAGGAAFNPATGTITDPAYTVNGNTYNNVGGALADLAGSTKFTDFNSTLAAANATGTNASAVGPNAQAAGNNASAFGVNSDASGNGSVALGAGAVATGTNSVALGMNSQAGTANAGWAGTVIGGQTMSNNVTGNAVVSISGGTTNRQLTGVADGAVNATSTDAVNGAQLFNTATALNTMSTNIGAGLASSLGGGASVSANGTVTNPTYNVAGGTQNNVGAALGALNTANNKANTGLAAAIGGGAAVAADGTVTAPVVPVNGTNYSNLTDAIAAAGAGFNFTTGASGSGVANGTSVAAIGAGETHTLTAGNNIITTQSGNDVTVALNPALSAITSIGVTGGPTIDGSGIAMNGDKITGLAAGSTAAGSTEAVNGGQVNTGLSSVATNLGGGSAYDPLTGTVTAPSYAIQGSTYTNVGSALTAVDGNLTNLLNGTAGLVQQVGGSPGAGQINVGAATGGTSVSFAGTSGNRVLTDVAAGAITAASDDAVNGAQVFANNQQVANLLGGGAGVNPATGALTAPSYTVGGSTVGTVGAAIAALQSGAPVQYSTAGAPTMPNGLVPSQNLTLVGAAAGPVTLDNVAPGALTAASTQAVNGSQINTLASSIAANTGGGSAFNPATGILTAPTISVGGSNYTNIAAAIEAGDDKADAGLADVAAALGGGATYDPATGDITNPSYSLGGTSYASVGDAFEAINAGRAGLVQQTGGAPGTGQLTVGEATGGTSLSVAGTSGNRVVTGVADGSVAAASSDAVNGGQLFAVQQAAGAATDTLGASVAANLGGSASYDPATDTVTGLSIAAAGTNHGTVTGAIEALNSAAGKANAGLASAFGGGASVAPDGTVTGPSFAVGGSTYTTVADALSGVGGNLTTINNAVNGGGIKYFHANSTQADSAPVGQDSVAIGPVSGAAGDRSISIGMGANAAGSQSIAIGTGNVVNGANSGAIGDPNTVNGSGSYALGNNNVIDANNAFVVGNNVTVAAGLNGAVAMGDGTSVAAPDTGTTSLTGGTVAGTAPASVVSVGSAGAERQITNVAAGVLSATSTNAVNGSQLFTVATAVNNTGASLAGLIGGGTVIAPNGTVTTAPSITAAGATHNNVTGAIQALNTANSTANNGLAAALGGGAAVAANGAVSAPSYTVQGGAHSSVGSALSAVDGSITNLNSAVTNLANGTTGLVQQAGGAPGAGAISIGATTGGTSINVAGTSGNRTVTGVAAGAVTAASSDAVNGAQLFAVQTTANGALQRSGGTLTGSINAGGNSITNLAGPVAAGDAANKGYVDTVGAAAAATSGSIGQSTAAALGGGSTYNPATGQVSAPSYSVGGRDYGNVGAALAATNSLAVQYVADANGAPTNAVRLTGNGGGQPVALGNVASGAVASGSTDAVNGGQLFAVQTTANGALQRSGGTLTGNLDLGGNRVTGLGAPQNAADAVNKSYVDTLQGQNLNQFSLLTSGLNSAFRRIERNSQGVALAMAMGGGYLDRDAKFSLHGAWGTFDGYNALAAQGFVRLTDDIVINGGVSFGMEDSVVGTRLGIGIQF